MARSRKIPTLRRPKTEGGIILVTIGFPRALAYYDYYPMWESFFEALNADIVVSDKTQKGILENGLRRAADGTCLPVKLFYGHVVDLINKGIDYVFVPRIVSVRKREFICPKFMGLPDMIRVSDTGGTGIIAPTVNLNLGPREFWRCAIESALPITSNRGKIARAFTRALAALHRHRRALLAENRSRGLVPGDTIGLLGHSYLIYDSYVVGSIIRKCREYGMTIRTADGIPERITDRWARELPKAMYWSSGRKTIGAARAMGDSGVRGIIHLVAFGCGTDSIVSEFVERTVRGGLGLPYLKLNIDEHAGEIGLLTRVEAFLDMLSRRHVQ